MFSANSYRGEYCVLCYTNKRKAIWKDGTRYHTNCVIRLYRCVSLGQSREKYGAMERIDFIGLLFYLGHAYSMNEESIKRFCHDKVVILICFLAEVGMSFVVDINMRKYWRKMQ